MVRLNGKDKGPLYDETRQLRHVTKRINLTVTTNEVGVDLYFPVVGNCG